MKRIVYIILAVLTVLALAGCSSGGPEVEIDTPDVVVTLPPDVEPNVPAGAPTGAPVIPEGSTPPEEEAMPEVKGKLGFITTDELNVRAEASTEAEALGKLPICKRVDVLAEDDGAGWCKIDYEGKEAYVASRYVKVLDVTSRIGTAEVQTDDLNMRSEPISNAEVVGKLAKGTVLDVYVKDAGEGWTLVAHEDRLVYVASRYLDIDAQSEI